jgi:hypothetical protein
LSFDRLLSEYCKLIEQVQACESSDEHHRMSGCSGSEEQELHKRREQTKQLCVAILFPDEVRQQQVANAVNTDALPANPSNVVATHETPLTTDDASDAKNAAAPRVVRNALENPENVLSIVDAIDPLPATALDALPAKAATNSNSNNNNNAAKKPVPPAGSSRTSYATTYFLLLVIVVFFVLHIVIYLIFVHNVVKNNTEQMNKMVTVLDELNLRLRRMNGEPDIDEVIAEEGIEEQPGVADEVKKTQ